MIILIPIICAVLFWLGGRDQMEWCKGFNQKLWRRLIIPIFLGMVSWVSTHSFISGIITGSLYAISLNILGWGENHWLRKWVGKELQWTIYGLFFGLSSFLSLPYLFVFQSVLASFSCWFLMKWANDGLSSLPYFYDKPQFAKIDKITHEYVEILFGLLGTILYLFI